MLNKVFVQNVSVKTVPVEVTQLCQTLDDIFSVKNDFSTFNALSLLYLLQLFIESDLTPNSRQLLTGESFVGQWDIEPATFGFGCQYFNNASP